MRRSKDTRFSRQCKKTCLLSTDAAHSAPMQILIHKMEKIERSSAEHGLSIASICATAKVRVRQWYRWRSGQAMPRPSSLRRMEKAIAQHAQLQARLDRGEGALPSVAYRMLLVTLAKDAGLDVTMVLTDDPREQDKQSPMRAAASLCRQRALYLIVTELNVPLVVAAGFAGISKQAVSKSLRQIEESRDDPAINAMLDGMALLIHGGVHG